MTQVRAALEEGCVQNPAAKAGADQRRPSWFRQGYANNSGHGQNSIAIVYTRRMRTVNDEAELPEHVRRNRVHWDELAAEYVGPGERAIHGSQ